MSRSQMNSAMPADRAEVLSDRADAMQFESYLERAREEIVSTVLGFGQWPQPRSVGLFFTSGSRRPKEFDLYEFLFDEDTPLIHPVEAQEFFVLALTDFSNCGAFSDSRNRFDKRITELLEAHFNDDHRLVREHAGKLMEDAEENA